MIPASLDSGHRMIADTLAAFRTGPMRSSVMLRPAPQVRPPLYIGIAGGNGAGKDTLANGLASALALPCASFAPHPFGLNRHEPDGTRAQAIDGRGDDVHPELRLRSLFARLPAGGLIPDLRFADEARAIRRHGGVVVRITRPGHACDGGATDVPLLPAELVDIEVNNDGSPSDLVRRALDQLLGRGVI